jgi:alpha-1,3-rhamnosyl/mannosyltransferase
VLDDDLLRAELVAAGLERSRDFTWQRCARETLAVLERVGLERRRAPPRGDVLVTANAPQP